MELALDVIIYIASFNRKTWYNLTLINEEFNEYVRTDAGINKYVSLFTKTKSKCGWTDDLNVTKLCGKIHSINDAPAVFNKYGFKCWYINGECSRNYDLPSAITVCGDQYWYKNGLRHRDDDKPAFIGIYGGLRWYKNDIEYNPNK
jgi:hypothetical protein